MQFKHPEILYALFALLIPVVIHLFQLQRFTKTPFTNVKFLKEIELQTRKSSRLKKWLVLLARLGVFASIIVAFAQPFFSKNDSSKQWMTTVYLDNSISMSAKGNRGELLKRAVQDIAENLPEKGVFNLVLNSKIAYDLSQKRFIEELKTTVYTSQNNSFKTILLQVKELINTNKNKHHKVILVSDFQKNALTVTQLKNQLSSFNQSIDLIQLNPKNPYNISIDSVYIKENNMDSRLLEVQIKQQGKASVEPLSISVLQNAIVLAKKSFKITSSEVKTLTLRIPAKVTNLTLKVAVEDAFLFDNTYRISFPESKKINVLAIGETTSFLKKIYTDKEFNYNLKAPNQVGYEVIDKQQLVVLNSLQTLPQALIVKLKDFVIKGGSLVLIPSQNNTVNELNKIFNQLNIGQLSGKYKDSLQVTTIHFSHPLIKNVFDKKVSNFQYPKVNNYFLGTLNKQQALLSYENEQAFISQIKKGKGSIFWVASPLDLSSSNFIKSPLIVPIFYNIGKNSTQHNQLSYRVGKENSIVVNQKLKQDEIVHITNATSDFIPRQEIQTDKVIIYTKNKPSKSGFYTVNDLNNVVLNLAFNYSKDESIFSFFNLKNIENLKVQQQDDIKKSLSDLSSDQQIQSYFKWFVLLALFFILIEIALLKFL